MTNRFHRELPNEFSEVGLSYFQQHEQFSVRLSWRQNLYSSFPCLHRICKDKLYFPSLFTLLIPFVQHCPQTCIDIRYLDLNKKPTVTSTCSTTHYSEGKTNFHYNYFHLYMVGF